MSCLERKISLGLTRHLTDEDWNELKKVMRQVIDSVIPGGYISCDSRDSKFKGKER